MSQLSLLFSIIFLTSLFMKSSTTSNVTSVSPNPTQVPQVATSQSASSAASSAATATGPSAQNSSNKAKSRAKASANAITNVYIENRQETQSPLQRYRDTLTAALKQIIRDVIKIKMMYQLINRTEIAYRTLMTTCGGKSTPGGQSR